MKTNEVTFRKTTNSSGASVWKAQWLGLSLEYFPATRRLLATDKESRTEVLDLDEDGILASVGGEEVTGSASGTDWAWVEAALRQVPQAAN